MPATAKQTVALDDLVTRMVFGYVILFGTIYVLMREMRAKNGIKLENFYGDGFHMFKKSH